MSTASNSYDNRREKLLGLLANKVLLRAEAFGLKVASPDAHGFIRERLSFLLAQGAISDKMIANLVGEAQGRKLLVPNREALLDRPPSPAESFASKLSALNQYNDREGSLPTLSPVRSSQVGSTVVGSRVSRTVPRTKAASSIGPASTVLSGNAQRAKFALTDPAKSTVSRSRSPTSSSPTKDPWYALVLADTVQHAEQVKLNRVKKQQVAEATRDYLGTQTKAREMMSEQEKSEDRAWAAVARTDAEQAQMDRDQAVEKARRKRDMERNGLDAQVEQNKSSKQLEEERRRREEQNEVIRAAQQENQAQRKILDAKKQRLEEAKMLMAKNQELAETKKYLEKAEKNADRMAAMQASEQPNFLELQRQQRVAQRKAGVEAREKAVRELEERQREKQMLEDSVQAKQERMMNEKESAEARARADRQAQRRQELVGILDTQVKGKVQDHSAEVNQSRKEREKLDRDAERQRAELQELKAMQKLQKAKQNKQLRDQLAVDTVLRSGAPMSEHERKLNQATLDKAETLGLSAGSLPMTKAHLAKPFDTESNTSMPAPQRFVRGAVAVSPGAVAPWMNR